MGVVWRNNDLRELRTRINLQSRIAADAAEQVIQMTTDEAVQVQKQLLDAAVTRTGAARISRGQGRTAGRNDSGTMIEAIDREVSFEQGRVVGKYGWVNGYQDYFSYQDFGTGRVPAAHSLLDSFVQMRIRFIQRMRRIVGQ